MNMNMKKFVASNSREALRMVRNALGADAVIISNRKLPNGVEIVALPHAYVEQMDARDEVEMPARPEPVRVKPATRVPEVITPDRHELEKILTSHTQNKQAAQKHKGAAPAQAAPRQAAPNNMTFEKEQKGILNEIKSMRDMLQDQLGCLVWSDVQQRDPKRSGVLRNLLNAGFSPALLRNMLDKMPDGSDMAWASQVLKKNLRLANKENDVVTRGGVYALVGPTGVGKTTTTAKLAARAVVRYGAAKVALITTDSYRIGAYEQLKIYGKILGVSVHAVRDSESLRQALAALKNKHLVLIDTMGMGQRDSRVATQSEILSATGVQRLLLLNATSGGDTLEDVVKMYGGAGLFGCILTKLDEAVKLGTVLDVVLRHKMLLHYVANGQRVPEDLHEVNPESLLHRALKLASEAGPFAVNELEFPAMMVAGKKAKGQVAHAI